MKQIKNIITKLLLVFVLVSLGFILGKHSVKSSPQSEIIDNGDKIIVYYLHSTFRCVTCNTIEQMTKSLLDSAFTDKLKEGKIEWKEVDFQEDVAIAQSFKVIASCVVVANVENGKVTDYKRLDDVWNLMDNPPSFNNYIASAIKGYLK